MEDLLETINSIEDENVRKEKLAKYEQLRRSLDDAEGISEILQSNVKPGGKYIVFIPVTDKDAELEDEDDHKIAEIIEKIDREYAYGRLQSHYLLGNALEIENWCKEKFEDKPVWKRRLPTTMAEDEEEKRLGKALNPIRKRIKQYEGIPIEKIEDEEDRKIAEIIDRLDREYNYKKIKSQDVGEAGFEVGIGNIDKLDEAERVLENLVEKEKEGGKNKENT